jgi:alkaline phosphatase D
VPPLFKGVYYFTVDQWDGFRSERTEILQQLASVENLVALTGDIHAFYAAELHVDFDAPGPKPIGVEYVTAGISSSPVQEITSVAVLSLDPPTPECPTGCFGLADLVPQFDQILTATSQHYKYANSQAHGVSVMEVNRKKEIRVHFFHIADVKTEAWDGSFERVSFRTASGSNVVEPA